MAEDVNGLTAAEVARLGQRMAALERDAAAARDERGRLRTELALAQAEIERLTEALDRHTEALPTERRARGTLQVSATKPFRLRQDPASGANAFVIHEGAVWFNGCAYTIGSTWTDGQKAFTVSGKTYIYVKLPLDAEGETLAPTLEISGSSWTADANWTTTFDEVTHLFRPLYVIEWNATLSRWDILKPELRADGELDFGAHIWPSVANVTQDAVDLTDAESGGETADTDYWEIEEHRGQMAKVVLTGRDFYDPDGDEVWYRFRRELRVDRFGHLCLIGPETRVTVATPELCE